MKGGEDSLGSEMASPKKLHFSGVQSDEENSSIIVNGGHDDTRIIRELKRPKMVKSNSSRRSLGDISVSSMNASTLQDQQKSQSPFRSTSGTSLTLESVDSASGDDDEIASDVGSDVSSVARLKGWLDDFGKQNRVHYERNNNLHKTMSIDSDCEADLSVAKLKGWLDDFGKQHKEHYKRNNRTEKPSVPPKPPVSSTPIVKSTPSSLMSSSVKPKTSTRIDPATAAAESRKGPTKTPVRIIKSRHNDVQATNDGYASVKKLSAWLADDPTSDKKTCTVRRGMNVIAKSRAFEKDLANVIVEEASIVRGHVSHKAKQIKSAFSEEDETKDETTAAVKVTDKKKWLESAFQKDGSVSAGAKDGTRAMSVSEKKAWLQQAFKKEEEKQRQAKAEAESAGGSEITSIAPAKTPTVRTTQMNQHPATVPSKPSSRTVVPQPAVEAPASAVKPSVDGDESPVDFKAARERLLQRSAENGNPVKILSKVDMKRNKFERINQENRRKSAAHGLLKPTWDNADPSVGPSNSYTKTFVDNVAPKKSFEELP
jgi:hypothetical protein